jgi:hypothetical protein
MPRPAAEEFFYLDDNGEKQDRELHGPILGAVDKVEKPIDEAIMAPIRARRRAEYQRQKQWQRAKAVAGRALQRTKNLQFGQNGLDRGWNEDEHPRYPAGSPQGGQFAPAGDGGGGGGGVQPPAPGATADRPGSDGRPPQRFARQDAGDVEGPRPVIAVYKPTPAAAAELKAKGATPLTFHELSGDRKGAEAFHAAIIAAKTGKYGAAVTAYPVDEYISTRLFLAPDGLSGFALKGDDIVSLFKHPASKADGVAATTLALATEQGGRRLDAFDTQLPRMYSKSGFAAVARLKWNDEHKPLGWDYATYADYNDGRPDVVFMVHDPARAAQYAKGDGPYVNDYDDGTALQRERAPAVKGYKPGVRGRGMVEVNNRRAAWVEASPVKTIDDVIRAAPIAQRAFGDAGRRIAEELGVDFKDPGAKTKTADGIARTAEKIAARDGLTARVTDTARGAFIINKPEQAEDVIRKLARTHEVVAEPWRTIKDSHYTDRALLFRDRATGLIGEVQIMDPKMWTAKQVGHTLYEEARVLPDGPRKDALLADMVAIYDKVLDGYDADWKAVDGRGGASGKS